MSMKVEGAYWKHTCNRCHETWYSKKELPKCCNECNSPYWNKPRVRPVPAARKRDAVRTTPV